MEVWCSEQNTTSMADLIRLIRRIMFQPNLPQHLTVKWDVFTFCSELTYLRNSWGKLKSDRHEREAGSLLTSTYVELPGLWQHYGSYYVKLTDTWKNITWAY